MKKILVSVLATVVLLGAATSASAHGGRGSYGGWHSGWAPFAVGAATGILVTNAYYRPRPVYYPPQYVYPQYPQSQSAAYCPENGLYYPQTQACPSGWQRVVY